MPTPEEHHAALAERGYSIAADVLTAGECDEFAATIDAMVGNWGRSLIQSFHGYRTVRYFDLLNAAPVFRTLPAHPAILPVVRAVLGHDCLLSTFGTVAIGPEEPAQAIHADDVLYRLPRPHRDIFCNVMVALSDFTEENGATRIVPGSNTWPDDPEIRIMRDGEIDDRYPSIPAEMARGQRVLLPRHDVPRWRRESHDDAADRDHDGVLRRVAAAPGELHHRRPPGARRHVRGRSPGGDGVEHGARRLVGTGLHRTRPLQRAARRQPGACGLPTPRALSARPSPNVVAMDGRAGTLADGVVAGPVR